MAQLILVWENGAVAVLHMGQSVEEMAVQLAAGHWPAGVSAGPLASPQEWQSLRIGGAALLLLPRKRGGLPVDEELRASLSPRQAQVLGLLGQGLKTAEIARRMGISARTVHYHTAQLRRRLGTVAAARSLPALLRGVDRAA